MSQQLNNLLAYSALTFSKKNSFKIPQLTAFIPNPSENDYSNGYITRHFAQKLNDKNSVIIEVDNKKMDNVRISGFFTVVSILWKIKGNNEDEIKVANKKSIKTVYQEMPRLSLYLPNLLQFAKF